MLFLKLRSLMWYFLDCFFMIDLKEDFKIFLGESVVMGYLILIG